MGRITLWGMYQYEPDLFKECILPVGLNKEEFITRLMRTRGELYPYHQVPGWIRTNSAEFFQERYDEWRRMYAALMAEYSPIENYDRTEEWDDKHTHSGNDVTTDTYGRGNTNTTNGTSTSQMDVSAYDSDDFQPREKNTQTPDITVRDQQDGSDSSNLAHGHVLDEKHKGRVHGNIGVTTNQQMIESEMNLRAKYNIIEIICAEYEYEFLVQVY